MDHGAIVGPIDSCVPAGGDWEALRGELVQVGGFRPGQEALQRRVHIELGGGSSLRNTVQFGAEPLGGIRGIDIGPRLTVVGVQVAQAVFEALGLLAEGEKA